MNHNRFDFDADLVTPFRDFLEEHDIWLDSRDIKDSSCFNFSPNLFKPPADVVSSEKIQSNRISFFGWFFKKFG